MTEPWSTKSKTGRPNERSCSLKKVPLCLEPEKKRQLKLKDPLCHRPVAPNRGAAALGCRELMPGVPPAIVIFIRIKPAWGAAKHLHY